MGFPEEFLAQADHCQYRGAGKDAGQRVDQSARHRAHQPAASQRHRRFTEVMHERQGSVLVSNLGAWPTYMTVLAD